MSDKRDQIGNLLPDIERLTPTGKIIRNTSIDEVLQLINVLKGEMSLVGPRPLLTEYLKHYSEFQARRHEVRPGITGLAQVMGRNKISWKEKFRCDVWYVDNLSFTLDLKILCKTFLNVLRQKDVNQSGDSTMEYFQPNEYEQ